MVVGKVSERDWARFLWSTAVLVLFASGTALRAQVVPTDAVVVVGAGTSGSWVTELALSNSTTAEAEWWLDTRFRYFLPSVCPGPCDWTGGALPPAGTIVLPTGIPTLLTRTQVRSFYVMPVTGPATAITVRARVVNSSRPTQAIEVPTIRLSTLVALNPTVLAFPGARRDATSRTNLVLTNIIPRLNQEQGSDATLLLEAYSSGGGLLGSQIVVLRFSETRFLVDVLAELGVTTLDVGQIRVTKVAGDGLFWGTMFTTTSDGGVSVSVGAHP